jgi:hypothetical protein
MQMILSAITNLHTSPPRSSRPGRRRRKDGHSIPLLARVWIRLVPADFASRRSVLRTKLIAAH